MNGTGNVNRFNGKAVNTSLIPKIYTLNFDLPFHPPPAPPSVRIVKRYLLRLINASFDTTFIFSIDNHNMTVITTDFVPIKPYNTTSVLIGIGQRYNVIVAADPLSDSKHAIPRDLNFWIRTWVAKTDKTNPGQPPRCGTPGTGAFYEQTGIVRYNPNSASDPTSLPWDVPLDCSDEPYTSLHPVLPWQVGPAANANNKNGGDKNGDVFQTPVGFVADMPLGLFSLERPGPPAFNPLKIDYGDPIFSHLDQINLNPPRGPPFNWPVPWVVIPEDYNTGNDWVR